MNSTREEPVLKAALMPVNFEQVVQLRDKLLDIGSILKVNIVIIY
ncbi:hypothetical protein SAMN05421863_106315 [Nitrosomonas communis]|uniref:Uncharacterized protein n=1 Tax=Nitrosomonas communis TaxID=44574 RepID=A0A1I4UDV4_9PROT|nr:hypothetical protein SAMN05421863_106315 [Nitrosomonas communis]